MAGNFSAELEDYAQAFRTRMRNQEGIDRDEHQFTATFLETLETHGTAPPTQHAYFKKKVGTKNAKVNAYGVDDASDRVDLVVTLLDPDDTEDLLLRPVKQRDVIAAVRAAIHVYETAIKHPAPYYKDMEPAHPETDMMRSLYETRDTTTAVTIIVLIAGIRQEGRSPIATSDFPLDRKLTLEIWDMLRLERVDGADRSHETLEIDLRKDFDITLPCLSAEPTADDHQCHLTIVPGELLFRLYNEYGAKLLELNVRSFLQARGKVNRGIRDTIQTNAEYFLAYNNGISATAQDITIETDKKSGAHSITALRGFQIVNGGQTVASIHRAKNRDRFDISQVSVQAKITVVEDEDNLDGLVPYISKYSNTQNRVTETDFSSNHPFHIQIGRLAEQNYVFGETSRWFYERARGQWEVARVKHGNTAARLRDFDKEHPKTQKFDKTLLAQAENAWKLLPHFVSLGAQKNFVKFMQQLTDRGDGWEPNTKDYREYVAKVILYKTAKKLATARNRAPKLTYPAAAYAYTVALLAHRNPRYEAVNLKQIWKDQVVSDQLKRILDRWLDNVHTAVVNSAKGKNVTEWAKKKECWLHVVTLKLDLNRDFPVAPLPGGEGRQANPDRLTPDQDRNLRAVMARSAADWQKITTWASKNDTLENQATRVKIAGKLFGLATNDWHDHPGKRDAEHGYVMLMVREAELRRKQRKEDPDPDE
jgi:hypothetical protein